MLDLLYSSDVDDHLPSARVLNTHHTFKILPKQYHNRKISINFKINGFVIFDMS